jgi:beta-galactosidase
MDGMTWTDHSANPGLVEYKKVIEPVTIARDGDSIVITNHYDFIDLSHLEVTWHLSGPSGNTESKPLDIPVIKGGESGTVKLPTGNTEDTWFTVNFNLKNDTKWAKKGHEVAWGQVPLFEEKKLELAKIASAPASPYSVKEKAGRLFITTPSFKSSLSYDLIRGHIQWSNEQGKILTKGPQLGIYRAQTQNDAGETGDGRWEWDKFHLYSTKMSVRSSEWKIENGVVTITSKVKVAPYILEWACNATLTYTIADDTISLHAKGDFSGTYPETIARVGLTMSLPKTYNSAEWFGRGPGESYRDKKASARFGLWSAGMDELNTAYEWPQENGNRTDTRWLRVKSSAFGEHGGPTLEARMDTPFSFSLRKHSLEDLDKCKHPHELTPLDETVLNLDYVQHGIGTGSCGPAPFEQHRLKTGPFEFSTSFKVVQ